MPGLVRDAVEAQAADQQVIPKIDNQAFRKTLWQRRDKCPVQIICLDTKGARTQQSAETLRGRRNRCSTIEIQAPGSAISHHGSFAAPVGKRLQVSTGPRPTDLFCIFMHIFVCTSPTT